jgi:integrase
MITIPGSKTGTRTRTIPISDDLFCWLEAVDLESPLVSRWDNRWRDMHRFCTRAKIDYVNFDDLRRTFASWLKQAGVDSKAVADMMGHKSTFMVDKVYGQLIAKLPATRRLYSV